MATNTDAKIRNKPTRLHPSKEVIAVDSGEASPTV